jgi:hypothetical protein
MKLCRYCNKYYPESRFGVALTTKKKIYRRHKCKSCYRVTKQKLANKYRQWLIDYKKKHKCSECGIADYRVLELHHLHNKKFTIAVGFYNHYGFKRIKEEVEKCIVTCANCHRILHYKERNNNIK